MLLADLSPIKLSHLSSTTPTLRTRTPPVSLGPTSDICGFCAKSVHTRRLASGRLSVALLRRLGRDPEHLADSPPAPTGFPRGSDGAGQATLTLRLADRRSA